VNTAKGFYNRKDLAQRYAQVSGRDISQLDFYVAFAYWKLACILEGVYARYLGGALGQKTPEELEPFALQVAGAAQMAANTLDALS
jgi:aminoglycoside phosphotransferase (APT) family kinase protein